MSDVHKAMAALAATETGLPEAGILATFNRNTLDHFRSHGVGRIVREDYRIYFDGEPLDIDELRTVLALQNQILPRLKTWQTPPTVLEALWLWDHAQSHFPGIATAFRVDLLGLLGYTVKVTPPQPQGQDHGRATTQSGSEGRVDSAAP